MSSLALILVLAAALVHATWNYLAKRAGGGAAFVWLFGLVSVALYSPIALWLLAERDWHITPTQLLFMAGTALIHAAYFLLLQRGYRAGDLSLVYPLARGTGPLLATLAAVAFFGERPTTLALAGAALVIGGILFMALRPRDLARAGAHPEAVGYGILTGVTIAAYTLWDKHAVAMLLIPPLVLDWASNLGRTLLVSPYALRHLVQVREVWRARRFEVIAVGVLCPLSYILVLTALVFTPVSYVAPARELSIVIGTLFGAHLLSEPHAPRRIVGAAVIVLGVLALALG
ncbi:MAG: EamA family transporter [Pseudomonadota bacterium]|nr:MAG: EamA family transporter [Pseudomonadota bacterium]